MGIREAVKACTTREQADDVMMGMELSGKARRRVLRVYHALPSVRAVRRPAPSITRSNEAAQIQEREETEMSRAFFNALVALDVALRPDCELLIRGQAHHQSRFAAPMSEVRDRIFNTKAGVMRRR